MALALKLLRKFYTKIKFLKFLLLYYLFQLLLLLNKSHFDNLTNRIEMMIIFTRISVHDDEILFLDEPKRQSLEENNDLLDWIFFHVEFICTD